MSQYTETAAATRPTVEGGIWRTVTSGDGTGEHDVADLVLRGTGGPHNKLVCRCGQQLGAAPYTLGHRLGPTVAAGRQNILAQHQRREAGLCVRCGKSSCWCDQTAGH